MTTSARVARAAAALVVSAVFLFPLYIALVTSLDTARHLFTYPPHLLLDFDFAVWARMWNMARWPMYFANTVFITAATVAIALATSSLAAYALSRLRFRGREGLFIAVLLVLMIPGEALLIPNYLILHDLGLLNTYWAQILPYGASVFAIFLLRQRFLSMPMAYWDAAQMDGVPHLRFLWSVALPVARPALITAGLFIFIGSWNSFQWPLIVTTRHSVQPIEVAVERLVLAHSVDWRRLSAAGVMATAPLMVLFLAVQRYIISGTRRGEGVQG